MDVESASSGFKILPKTFEISNRRGSKSAFTGVASPRPRSPHGGSGFQLEGACGFYAGLTLFHSGECPVNKITAVAVPYPDFGADSMQMSNTESYLDLLSMGGHNLLRIGQ